MSYLDYNSVFDFVDIDEDGDFDLFVGESYGNIKFLQNTGNADSPHFIPQAVDVGYYATPTFADIDKDGDLDMFVGEKDKVNFFENIGDNNTPDFSFSEDTAPFGLSGFSNPTPVFIDIDLDGDLDFFSGRNANGDRIQFFENTSTDSSIPAFTPSTDEMPFGLFGNGWASINFVDIDDDGDIDAFVGGEFNFDAALFFFENTSSDSSIPAFTRNSDSTPFGIELSFLATRPIASFVDIDGDEDFDLFVGSAINSLQFYENIGSKENPSFVISSDSAPFDLSIGIGGSFATPVILDIDNDNLYEAVIGEYYGNLNYFESDISTSLSNLEVTTFNNQNTQFCLNTNKVFTEVSLGNRGCDRNGNAIYTASVTPANQGVTASVVGTGEIEGDCNFFIELNTSETAIAGNYSINLTIEDEDDVGNSSSTPEIVNTGTVIVFNLGIVEVLNLEEVEVEPILGTTIDNGTSEDFMVNINNTTSTTTYEWMVGGVALPIMTGDDVDTGTAIPIDLGDGNIINVSASTESVVGDFTQSILTIENPTAGAAQDFEVSLTATQECGSDTQTAIFTSGNFNCSDENIVLANRALPTDNYEALNTITSQSIIPPESGVSFAAGNEVKLLSPFHAQHGSTFVAKIEDCTTEIGEELEERSLQEKQPSLTNLTIAPNPASNVTTIELNIPNKTTVSLELYNIRGQRLQQLINQRDMEAGVYPVTLPLEHFQEQMYFVLLRCDENTIVKKLSVLKQ